MKSHLQLTKSYAYTLPREFQWHDVRMGSGLVEYFLKEFTREGDLVLDPFAGFGTTLYAAESMGRVAYGIEYTEKKAKFIQSRLSHPERLIHGDSRQLAKYDLPPFDFCMTSPPYTNKEETDNPFSDYKELNYDYPSYLRDMRGIFEQVKRVLKPGAHAVVEMSNIKTPQGVTTLAWDVARELSQVFTFLGEIVVCWDKYDFGYDHSYCLVFSK
ncbi:MAG: DNA methyltransferase [Chloroflexota bacterium]